MKPFVSSLACFLACAPVFVAGRADPSATARTHALYDQLVSLAEEDAAAWGHQYGIFRGISRRGGGWTNEREPLIHSDAKNITGAHPAITGWDFDEIWNPTTFANQAIAADALGIINIFSYHMDNPVTGGNYQDTNLDLPEVLPGGEAHESFRALWQSAADFIESLVDAEGNAIPVIVRPYHEMSGRWFWWGSQHPVEDYVSLWRWTVEYLRDERGLHNILYCYSPDKTSSTSDFLRWWPGDDYVDLVGLDYYRSAPGGNAAFVANVQVLLAVSEEKGMPAALTEVGTQSNGTLIHPTNGRTISTFGLGGMSDPDWWLNAVYQPLSDNDLFSGIAFIAGWANWGLDQFHVPTPSDKSAPGFVTFARQPEILMLPDLNPATSWTAFPGAGWLYTPDFPWVYHIDHGWWYMHHDFHPASYYLQWYHDFDLGWLFTTEEAYPDLYNGEHGWLRFEGSGEDDTRVFYSYTLGDNVVFPLQ